ncbi:MAG: oxidoreductase [Rhodovulum sulfidophilum]|uniref:Oxidoreductase n=1 Tax=Rhodovulum sulfidophilum TaxID=35806 RepID=A0A2W5QD22_RHOSU|nr:MAG: oxidoreductase [Rhodovulum sulfidophilum]
MGGHVRWGILGAAKIAREFVAPAIHASARGVVAGVASRGSGRAEALAAPYPGARIFGSYEAMLADPAIDAVYIPLPNSQHVEWTLKCLAAGKHVLCEKPIALRAEEIDAIIAARDASGKHAAEAFMVTHHPQWHRVRALLAEGAIGPLRHVQGAFSFFNADAGNIRNQPELGGGALRDIGVYPSVTTRFATGLEPVAARAALIDWDMGIDATATVVVDFPGFRMDFYTSMRMAPRQRMVFHGEQGFIALHTPFNTRVYGEAALELRGADGRTVIERFPGADQYRAQIDAFDATVLDGAPYDCPLEFSRGNQVMIDMIYDAAKS